MRKGKQVAYNYTIVEGENRSLYYVKEKKTGHVIASFAEFCQARAFMVKMNNGLAFDGWTPKFFLK